MPDPNLTAVVEATKWFSFSDTVQHQINHLQNYTVYPYLQFGFAAWHLMFATLAWPKINFPSKGFEVSECSKSSEMSWMNNSALASIDTLNKNSNWIIRTLI